MDDLLIATRTIDENLEYLRLVMERMKEYGLQIRLDKCSFVKTQLEYLGYRITKNEIKPGLTKTEAVRQFPTPRTQRQLRGFLGLTGYFRRFVRNYSLIAKPLTYLLKNDAKFDITKEHIQAIERLKESLISEPVLKIYSPMKETEIHTDASSHGFGAILLQKQEDQKFHPVYFYSGKTTDEQKNYHSFELETLAVVKALERFRVYVLGKPFVLVTDCDAMRRTLDKKEINRKIARWSLALQEYSFTTEHRKAEKMAHVDGLSRCYDVNTIEDDDYDGLLILQDLDPEISEIKKKKTEDDQNLQDYKIIKGKLFRIIKQECLFVVPRGLRRDLVMKIHERVAHMGADKTTAELRKKYYFRNMCKYVKNCLANCLRCLEYDQRAGAKEGFLHSIEKGTKPWDTIHIDHVGPLIKTTAGHRHIFEAIDGFLKFTLLEAVKSTSTAETLKALDAMFRIFGAPRRIISDRGSAFTSNDFENYCEKYGIQHVKVAVQTPRGNGKIERYNRIIIPALCKPTEKPDQWHTVLGTVQLALNNSVQRTIRRSPAEVMFGHGLRQGPLDTITDTLNEELQLEQLKEHREEIRRQTTDNITHSQQQQKRGYDRKRKPYSMFQPGEYVTIRQVNPIEDGSKKMARKYIGPYLIKQKLDWDRYLVGDIPGHQLKQRPYESILPPERLKRWITIDEDPEDDPEYSENKQLDDTAEAAVASGEAEL